MTISTLGIDPAKSVFQLHGITADGEVILQKRVRRPCQGNRVAARR